MKTIIKTNDLVKILDLNEGVIYKDQEVKLDFEKINQYVLNPKFYKVFEPSPDIEDALYKNLALYVINSNENSKYIQIDLDKDNPIENGLFELVKNIVNDEKLTYIKLPDAGNNLIFIKSKNLEELPATENALVEKATDVELGGRTSVFMRTEKVTEKEKFFWTADSSDRYSDANFVIDKLVNVAKSINFSKSSMMDKDDRSDKEFFNVLKVSDQNLIKSDEFKLALLRANNENINQIIIKNNQPDLFSIDFSADFVRDFLLEQAGNNNFNLLSAIFKHNAFAKNKNTYTWVRDAVAAGKMKFETVHNVQFSPIINHPDTIKFLLEHTGRGLNLYGEDEQFSIVSAYPYFDEKNKVEPNIVNKFLSVIIVTNSYSEKRIHENQLYRMPMSLFNEKYFLEKVCPFLEFDKLKSRFKAYDIEPKLLGDKAFIIGNCSKVPEYRLLKWISTFVPKEDITKDFLLNMVRVKPDFCKTIIDNNFFKNFSDDKDIIFTAAKYGFSITQVPSRQMKEFLLEHDNQDYEYFKVKYLIDSGEYKSGNKWFKDPEQAKKFEEKYLKPEYMYFAKDDYFYSDYFREQIQKKFKTPMEVLDTLEKIQQFPHKYKFRGDYFYKELPKHLQANKKIVETILNCEGKAFPFTELSESMQYNSDLALKFIKLDPKNTPDIPKEFFNDIGFSLEFSKLIDRGLFRGRESLIPEFVTKFFDNQGIKEKYHEKLEHYVSVFSLKEALDEKPVQTVQKKKVKI